MTDHYYSIATARYIDMPPEAVLVAGAVRWLLGKRNPTGTWGGPDTLDEFISTTHAVMALLCVGVSPTSDTLRSATFYLERLDKERNLSFYWRSGVFLNLPAYRQLVQEDANFIWENRGRVAVHRDYPVNFFLLKLVRFGDLERDLPFSVNDVVDRILADWDRERGWYGRTSITTMALGLIYDLEFRNKQEIIQAATRFVASQYRAIDGGDGVLHDNIVDDAFSVFNLAERKFLKSPDGKALALPIENVVRHIVSKCLNGDHWRSDPPFGGSVGPEIYPTAVMVRALISFYSQEEEFLAQVSSCLIDGTVGPASLSNLLRPVLSPFWGELVTAKSDEEFCFVLMPFSPPKLTQIYERYVKHPIESELRIRCIRADDIYRSSNIMKDVWEHINRAKIIIADMTGKNPNVFYELGMAHVLGKEVILIAQAVGDVPFDLRGIRSILYEDSPAGYERLSEQILLFVQHTMGRSRSEPNGRHLGRRPRSRRVVS